MFGLGVLKGLGITLKHFVNTFVDDLKYFSGDTATGQQLLDRKHGAEGMGLFTVQYPEVKLAPPENFRFVPFLVTDYDVAKEAEEYDFSQAQSQARCTSCGICAKVCPPQCIWIVRTNDPATGKPIPQPAEFYIDTDICMNCGYCAEFCPFDAIKMDHDYELADYERDTGHVHDIRRLLKPVSYYAEIRPSWYAQEEEAKRQAEEEKRRKEEEKARAAAEKAAAAKAAKAAAAKAEADKPAGKRSPEEIKAQREAMMARKAAKAAGQEVPAAAEPAEKPKRSPEEIKAQRDAMMARKAAKAAGQPVEDVPPAAPAEKPKRTSEEVKAQRDAMMARRAAKAAGLPVEEEKPAEAAPPPEPAEKPKRTPEEVKAQRDAMMARRAAKAAGLPVETEAPKAAAETPVAADDLTKIEGIGPKISKTLQAAGFTTFAQLAAADPSRLEEVLQQAELRLAKPDTWPEQAQLAANGEWDKLEKLQDELHHGKRV